MTNSATTSSFARLSPWQARGVLIAFAVLIGAGLWCAPPRAELHDANDKGNRKLADIFLYVAEVERIHAGEGYYQAADAELRERGYPTASVLNWRTPLPIWLIGRLPDPMYARVLLIAAGIVAMLLAYVAASREDPKRLRMAVPLVVLLTGSMFPCLQGDVFMMSEIWGGVMIALSLGAYGADRRTLGAVAALAALVFRELALPYCLLGLVLALWQRRRNESILYVVGLAGWAVFYGVHCWEVSQWVTPASVAHRHSWFQFGGLAFVLALTQTSAVLVTLPSWVTVVFFALAMVGFAGWNTAWGTRIALTAAMYVAAFSIVGQDFNTYWGQMIAPLMCFGVVRSRGAMGDLWRAAELPWPQRLSSQTSSNEDKRETTQDTTTTSTRCPTKEDQANEAENSLVTPQSLLR